MSDTEFDVVIAAYSIQDRATEGFDRLVDLVKSKELDVEGVVLVRKDFDGQISLEETGDHLGRKGLKIGGGVGLVVGLFAPPLLASVVVGGAVGGLIAKFAKHRVDKGLEAKMDDALAPGWAGVIAIYDRSKSDVVEACMVGAMKTSTAHVDGPGAKQLKAALAEAGAS